MHLKNVEQHQRDQRRCESHVLDPHAPAPATDLRTCRPAQRKTAESVQALS